MTSNLAHVSPNVQNAFFEHRIAWACTDLLSITILLVDCKKLEECTTERPDTLAVRGGHSLQSTSQIVVRAVSWLYGADRTFSIVILILGSESLGHLFLRSDTTQVTTHRIVFGLPITQKSNWPKTIS